MAAGTDQVRVLAAALHQLRGAATPTARVQAVRTATRAVQGLAAEDRQVLLERLLAHGAPVAAGAVSRHLEDLEVPPAAQTAIAQDLLGLAPVEVARIAQELLEASAAAPAPGPEAGWAPPSTPPDPDLPPPADPDPPPPAAPPTPPPVPATMATDGKPGRRTPLQHRTPTPVRARPRSGAIPAQRPTPARRQADRHLADRWDELATALADAPDVRGRRDLLAGLAVRVPGDRLPALLAATPPGWQRRMVLRRLLDGPGIHGPVPASVLTVLDRDGDRFAVAAQLARAGLADVDILAAALPERLAARLQGRRATVR